MDLGLRAHIRAVVKWAMMSGNTPQAPKQEWSIMRRRRTGPSETITDTWRSVRDAERDAAARAELARTKAARELVRKALVDARQVEETPRTGKERKMLDWLEDHTAAVGWLSVTLVLLWVALAVFVAIAKHELGEPRSLYDAWSKAHPGIELTIDEWQALRRENLLPR
jgi:hypothetical protein